MCRRPASKAGKLIHVAPNMAICQDCICLLYTSSTSVKREDTDFTSALVDDVKGMRIGIPKDYFGEGLNPEVKEAVLAAAKVLEEKGAIEMCIRDSL